MFFCHPGYGVDESGDTCSACEIGKYQNSTTPPTICQLCDAGRYNVETGLTECKECAGGKLSSADRTQCKDCSGGEFVYNDTSCEYCTAGKYAPAAQVDDCLDCVAGFSTGQKIGATSCSACDAGSYSSGMAVNCSACPAGTYSSTRDDECTNCTAGSYSATDSSSSCSSCEAGRYQGGERHTACVACAAGLYSNAGAHACTACTGGTYSDAEKSACVRCDGGKWSNASAAQCVQCVAGRSSTTGSSSCEACAEGKRSAAGASSCESCFGGYFSSAGSVNCSACAGGTYSNPGSAVCFNCTSGTYSESSSSACAKCDAGRVSERNGADACERCPAGKISATGDSKCEDCPEEYFQDKAGQSACKMCSQRRGLTSTKGSTSCNLCMPHYYSGRTTPANKTGEAAHLDCISCPEGTSCDVGTFIWSLNILPGHYRFSQDSANVYTCKYAGNCIGTPSDDANDNASLCLDGSGGPTCSVCDEGYYLDVEADQCGLCDAVKSSSSSMLFYVMAGVALFVVLLLVGAGIYNRELLVRKRAEWKPTIRLWSARMSQVVKTMQIIVLLNYNFVETSLGSPTMGNSRDGYPKPYSQFVGLFEFLSLDISFLPLSCVASQRFGHAEALLASTLVPLGVVGLGIVAIKVMRYRDKDFNATGISQGLVAFIILLVPSVSRTICQSFRCIQYDRQYAFLVADVSIDCTSKLYEAQFVYAIVATLIFPVGVPAVFMAMLWPLRRRLDPPAGNEAEAIAIRTNDETLTRVVVAQVFRKYRPRYWWYEIFDMYRRLSLTCFLLIFDKPAGMIIFALGIAMLTTVMQREAQPYLDPWLASLSNLAHWQIVLCCVAILLVHSAVVESPNDLVSIGALLLVMNVCLMLAVFTDTKATLRRMAKIEAAVTRHAATTEAMFRRSSDHLKRGSFAIELGALSWGDSSPFDGTDAIELQSNPLRSVDHPSTPTLMTADAATTDARGRAISEGVFVNPLVARGLSARRLADTELREST